MKASRGMGAIALNKIPKDGKSAVLLKKGGTVKKAVKKFSGTDGQSQVSATTPGSDPNATLVAQFDPASMTQAQRDAYNASLGQADFLQGKKKGGKISAVKQSKRKTK